MKIDTKNCKLNTYLTSSGNNWTFIVTNKSGTPSSTKYPSNNKALGNLLLKRVELRKNAPREALSTLQSLSTEKEKMFEQYEPTVAKLQEIRLDKLSPNSVLSRINQDKNGKSYWQWGYYNAKNEFAPYGMYGLMPNLLNHVVEHLSREKEQEYDNIESYIEDLKELYLKAEETLKELTNK